MNVSIKKRILVVCCQWVNKQSLDFAYHSERVFQREFLPQGSINKVKGLSFSIVECFGAFQMLLFEGLFERDFLDIYLTTSSRVGKF